MNQPAIALDYQELTRRLSGSDLSPSAAEAHGMLCALLCAGAPRAEETWIGELLATTDDDGLSARECRRSLHELAAQTRRQLAGSDLDFNPLLPDDTAPLAQRALGLYDFSRGFLYGLGLAGVDAGRLSAQTREAFDDLLAITRLDLEGLEDTEENEQALMELTEFVRVAALLVHAEQARAREPAAE